MLSSDKKFVYSCLCSIDPTPDSYLIQLQIVIHVANRLFKMAAAMICVLQRKI